MTGCADFQYLDLGQIHKAASSALSSGVVVPEGLAWQQFDGYRRCVKNRRVPFAWLVARSRRATGTALLFIPDCLNAGIFLC
jgi:hypothetical protein